MVILKMKPNVFFTCCVWKEAKSSLSKMRKSFWKIVLQSASLAEFVESSHKVSTSKLRKPMMEIENFTKLQLQSWKSEWWRLKNYTIIKHLRQASKRSQLKNHGSSNIVITPPYPPIFTVLAMLRFTNTQFFPIIRKSAQASERRSLQQIEFIQNTLNIYSI